MHLHHSVVEAEVLLTRIERGEIETGWDAAGGWDVRRQQLLVDTVLRDWPLPAIVLAGDDEADVLLDGRERLRALWRFVHDELPVGGTTPADGEYLEQLDGLHYSRLPERFRRRVRHYGVLVVRVPGHADGEVRELMARWDPTTPAFRPAPESSSLASPSLAPPPAIPPPPPVVEPTPTPAAPIAPPPTVPPPPATPPLPAAREPGDAFRPVVPSAPAEPAVPEQPAGAHRRSAASEPIFDELSAWFLEETGPADAPAWSSPADTAHETARAALRESTVELTPAGLPQRQPAARLVPGAIHAPARARPAPSPDPRTVGEHLNRFREGASAARHDLSPPA